MRTHDFLRSEASALLHRLTLVQPFARTMPMVAAAAVHRPAMQAIDGHLAQTRQRLKHSVQLFLTWLASAEGQATTADAQQARFALLRLRFNNVLDQLDIFADVLAQRAEHTTGMWVAGLDALAADALTVGQHRYEPPQVVCFLERGHGAAIRRARTRLPGGDLNPVAVIQVPRERMVGSGLASSLIHEVGHQGAALLSLNESLRDDLRTAETRDPARQQAWQLLSRWISEISADCWAMGHLGIGATLGLMGVVSLPRYFVFRIGPTDPHPFPWIRVKISLAVGARWFPHPQWAQLSALWEQLYPRQGLPEAQQQLLSVLEMTLPAFAELLTQHRSKTLGAQQLADLFPLEHRQPARLLEHFNRLGTHAAAYFHLPPTLVLAIVGQARAAGQITAAAESHLLSDCLVHWAESRTSQPQAVAAATPPIFSHLNQSRNESFSF